jgi:DNA-binding CsgD family transcriptional regulator
MHVDYSSLGHPQRLKAYPLPHTLHATAVTAASPPLNLKVVPAAEADRPLKEKKAPPPSCSSGFLLMDSSLSTILFNAEAIQILSYPARLPNARRPEAFLAEKIRSSLIRPGHSAESPFVTEFRSGRRRYLCRAFLVDTQDKGPSHANIALLLERGSSALIALSQVSQQFNLTGREQEALEYLVQGLSSKEIADRMNISSNTVKTFLRLIMIKMGVSSRMAVVRKIIATEP